MCFYAKDHLGNNRATYYVTPIDELGVQVKDINNYYPYGMEFNENPYQINVGFNPELDFTYNGKESQTMHGLNMLDYGARFIDMAKPDWTSVDPLCEKYYSISPYAYCAGNPVNRIDPDGREVWIAHRFDDGKTTSVQYKNGTLYNSDGSKYKGSNPYILTTSKHLNQLKTTSDETNTIISSLDADDNKHTITNLDLANPNQKGNFNREVSILSDGLIESITESGGTVTKYDSDATSNVRGQKRDPKVGLIHELKHAYDTTNGGLRAGQTSTGDPNYEVDAVNVENQVRSKTADPKRTEFGGKKIPNKDLK